MPLHVSGLEEKDAFRHQHLLHLSPQMRQRQTRQMPLCQEHRHHPLAADPLILQ